MNKRFLFKLLVKFFIIRKNAKIVVTGKKQNDMTLARDDTIFRGFSKRKIFLERRNGCFLEPDNNYMF